MYGLMPQLLSGDPEVLATPSGEAEMVCRP